MATTLELNFTAQDGPAKMSIRNPKDSLTPAEIKAAMQGMTASGVFTSGNGQLVSAKSARLVDRVTQDIELA
ncbi:MAG: DUF2922 domain-containing protein [Bacillus sp. (in: firmicutes)]